MALFPDKQICTVYGRLPYTVHIVFFDMENQITLSNRQTREMPTTMMVPGTATLQYLPQVMG